MAADKPIVSIETESDTPTGWEFGVRVSRGEEAPRAITLRMSWADFEHWSGGATPPSMVAQAVVELALERLNGEQPRGAKLGDFDAAMLRRWFPGADETLRQRLCREG